MTTLNTAHATTANAAARGTDALLTLAGRAGLAAIFLSSGLEKIGSYAGTAAWMDGSGVPGALLPAVIALEVLGGLAILLGFLTRWAALALAGFTAVAAVLFHAELADPVQAIMFWKNIAIAGGFLVLAANGPGRFSLDARRRAA